MRKLFNLAMVALLTIGAVSCSKDSDSDNGTTQPGDQLTINLEGLGSVNTRAIALPAENDVNDFSIYMFESSGGAFKKKFVAGTDFQLIGTGLTRTITLTNISSYGTGAKNFYFVANQGTASTALSATPTSEAAFLELLTNELAIDGQSKADNIVIGSNGLLFTQRALNVNPAAGTITQKVSMRRRVARFDIVNPYTDVDVQKVYVQDAKRRGYVWADATGIPVQTINVADHKEITGPTAYQTISSERIAQSVFYLNPTTVKADGTQTQIGVLASYKGGNAQIYTVDVAADLEIRANYRYKLVVNDKMLPGTGDLTFSLVEFEDWTEGSSHELQPDENDTFTVNNFVASTPGNWTLGTLTYNFSDNAAGTLKFTATSGRGTSVRLTTVEGDINDLTTDIDVTKTSVVSYSGYTVTEDYTVTLPQSSVNGFFEFALEVYSHQSTTAAPVIIKIVDDAMTIDASMFPDAAFRNYVITTLNGGSTTLRKATADAVTTIDLEAAGITNVASLKGVEYFENLDVLNAKDNASLSDIDLSKNTALTRLSLHDCSGLSSLDVSNNTKLVYLGFPGLNISPVDLSKNTELETLTLGRNNSTTSLDFTANTKLKALYANHSPNLSTIDVSKCPDLTLLNLDECTSLETVDVSKNTLLEYFNGNRTAIKTLDFSANPQLNFITVEYALDLTTITIPYCPNLEKINSIGCSKLASFNFADHAPNLTQLHINDNILPGEELSVVCFPKLTSLGVRNTLFKTIDMSVNEEILYFSFTGMTNLTTIKVWNGFPVATPWTHFTEEYTGPIAGTWTWQVVL